MNWMNADYDAENGVTTERVGNEIRETRYVKRCSDRQCSEWCDCSDETEVYFACAICEDRCEGIYEIGHGDQWLLVCKACDEAKEVPAVAAERMVA